MSATTKPNRARWRPRSVSPTKPGTYECAARFTSAVRGLVRWDLEWDGVGFLVPIPMAVVKWRPKAAPEVPRG